MDVMPRLHVWYRILIAPSWKWLILAPLAVLGYFQSIREEFLASEQQGYLRLLNFVPDWPTSVWLLAATVVVVAIILESAYREIRDRDRLLNSRWNHEETVSCFAALVREAESLKIIWAGQSGQQEVPNAVFQEAITWSRKAIAAIFKRLGTVADQQVRMKAGLPLFGDIQDEDFEVQFAHAAGMDKLGLIRKRHYELYNWMKDFIENAPQVPDIATPRRL